jgi:hypothetical protein
VVTHASYTVQWLRAEGADWPEKLCYGTHAWPDELVAWCRSEGCDSPLPTELQLLEVDDDDDTELELAD